VSAQGQQGKCFPGLIPPLQVEMHWRGVGVIGTPPWLASFLYLSHFCPCQPSPPALPRQSTLRLNGGTRVRRLQHQPQNNRFEKEEGAEADRPTDRRKEETGVFNLSEQVGR
jgi:hypothetical protein